MLFIIGTKYLMKQYAFNLCFLTVYNILADFLRILIKHVKLNVLFINYNSILILVNKYRSSNIKCKKC